MHNNRDRFFYIEWITQINNQNEQLKVVIFYIE
jgi:hypothetical protein